MVKDPFKDEEPLQPMSSLDSLYYGQNPQQRPLEPVPPPQEETSVFGDPSKEKSQGFFRDLWSNFSRIAHNRSRQYTPEELERFRREVMPPDFESKATIGQQLENLGEVSASGLNSLSYPLYKATNELPLPGLRLAARTFYGDLPLWAASLPSAITASAGRMIYPVELAMKSDEDEGVVHAREQLLEKNQGLPWKPDDPANFVGLGTVPGKNFSLGTFAGKEFAERLWAAGIKKPLETLHLAQQLEKDGRSSADIWMETAKINMAENNNYIGWEKGKDGNWKLEVHDQASFNKNGPDIGPLTESYRNPPVEKGIDLGDITLSRNPKEFGGEYNADFVNPEIGVGTRAFATKTQNPNVFGKEWSPRSVASHEVQHFIQDVEKWQNGSNPDAILKGHYGEEVNAILKKRQIELYKEALESTPAAKLAPEEHQRAMLDAARKDAAFELYEKVAGEVEARNVQNRLDMTPEERLAKRPELTEDVPRDQQILDRKLAPVVAKAEPPPIPKEIDQAGYFSGAWEAAKRLTQFKGTPEQMLAQLKKLGAKDNEIKATGLDKFLEGKTSVTKKEIADYLADNRTKLNEVTKQSYEPPNYSYRNEGAEQIGVYYNNEKVATIQPGAFNQIEVLWPNAPATYHRTLADAKAGIERMSFKGKTQWSSYSIEPKNPTYRETVLHLPAIFGDPIAKVQQISPNRWSAHVMRRGISATDGFSKTFHSEAEARNWAKQEAAKLGQQTHLTNDNFRSGHWSEPNIIAHIRSSIQKTADGKKVFTLNELQSDWGQKIRDRGIIDDAKVAELQKRYDDASKVYQDFAVKQSDVADLARVSEKASALLEARDLAFAELNTAKTAVHSHPLVNTTNQWVNTALRNVIKQAVDAGADHIAIASGKTVDKFGMGAPLEGLQYAYDKMYPKNLRNILQKIDPEAAKATTLERLKSNDGSKDLGDGFTLFPITDKVRQVVQREGQPMFSKHRDKTAMQEALEKLKAENAKTPEPTLPPTGPPVPPADKARIVPSPEKKDPFTFDKFYTAAKDDLHPIRRMEEQLLEGRRGTLAEPDKSPYVLSRLTRGLEGRVQQAMRYSMYRFKDMKNVGPGLEKILEPIKIKDREAFEQYLVYKRALELNNRGIETGFDPRNASAFVRKNAARFDNVAKQVTRFAQQGLEYLRDSGVISKDAYTRMVESNKDYVPFYRLMEDGGDITSIPNTLRNPVKEIKGSERDVISPLESIVRNTYAFIGIAERNRALNAMKDLADANPAVGKQLMQRIVNKTDMEAMQKAGVDTKDFQVFKPDVFHPARDEIVLFRNGERQTYKVAPEVAEAVKSLNREELNWVVKAAAMPARWLRAGATLAPEFIARNPIRDQFSATILSNNNYVPLVSMIEGLAHTLMGSKQYQAAMKGGGFNANLVSLDRKYINDNLLRLQDPTVMGRIKGVVTSPVEALRKMSELMENATRMGEFLQARRGGKSIFNSAYDMREVTLDFARMGAKGRALNAITAFWNANLEGTDRLGRAMYENPARTSVKALAGIALPSALLWWATHDDERMKEVPKWERDTFWVIPMDDWQPIDADKAATIPKAYKRQIDGQWFQNKGEIIKIPKPFTEGIILGSGTERALEAMYGNDPKAWKQFGKSIWGALVPGLIPTGALPPLEVGFGRSWFLDRDIVPKYLQRVDPKEQYNPYTSETAKFLGRQVAKVNDETSLGSPLVLEHIYRGYTGGLGKLALEGVEKGLELTGAVDKKNWPTNKNADIPLLRAFASRHPSSSVESIQQFYDEYEKREKAKNTAKLLDTRGDTDGARKIREERALANATSTHTQIGAMNKQVRAVYDDKKLSPDEKREKIDLLYLKMINLAQKANEMFRATEKKPTKKSEPAKIEDPFKVKVEDPFKSLQ